MSKVPSPADETDCNPYLFTMLDRNRSATTTNIFRSFNISTTRISLCLDSRTTHQNDINSEEPAL